MPDDLPGSQNQEQKQPTAEEQMGNMVNAAVSAHIKRFAEKQFPTLIEAALKPVFDKLNAPPPAPPGEEDAKSKGKKPDVSPEFQALQAKLTDWETKYATAESARLAAEKKSRDDKAQNELRSHLQPHVKPELLDILSDHLYHRKSVVDFEEDGTPIFKSKKTDAWGGEEEVRLPLKAGVEQFLKSNDAKPFIPAPGSSSAPPMKKTAPGGSSNSAGQQTDPTKMTENEKIRRAMEITAQLEKR